MLYFFINVLKFNYRELKKYLNNSKRRLNYLKKF